MVLVALPAIIGLCVNLYFHYAILYGALVQTPDWALNLVWPMFLYGLGSLAASKHNRPSRYYKSPLFHFGVIPLTVYAGLLFVLTWQIRGLPESALVSTALYAGIWVSFGAHCLSAHKTPSESSVADKGEAIAEANQRCP